MLGRRIPQKLRDSKPCSLNRTSTLHVMRCCRGFPLETAFPRTRPAQQQKVGFKAHRLQGGNAPMPRLGKARRAV